MKKILLVLVFFLFTQPAFSVNEFDFDFRDMSFHKAVESIAKLMNRNVIFGKGIDPKNVTMKVTKVTPEVALKLLLESNGYSYRIKHEILYITAYSSDKESQATNTTVIPLVNIIAKDIDAQLRAVLPKDMTYTINEPMNAFIMTGTDESIAAARKLINDLDQEITQIFIESKIVETSSSFAREFGIEWGSKEVRSSGGSKSQIGGGAGLNVSATTPNVLLGTSIGIGQTQIEAKIQAGESSGDAKVISNPKITTLNGQAATIESSNIFSFKTLVSSNGSTSASGTIEKVKAGIKFTVTPFTVSDEKVRLNINLTKSLPGDANGDGIPQVSESTASTTLVVKNGQTASLAGIMIQSATASMAGAPFLAQIPILGLLFGTQTKKKENRELLIFITPTIYRSDRGGASKRQLGSSEASLGGEELESVLGRLQEEPKVESRKINSILPKDMPIQAPVEKFFERAQPKE